MSQQQQRYRVIEKIAAGGMAEVYRAESAGLEGFKKIVAIKRVLPHLSEKKKFIGMFLDEARVSAQLSHSNCVQVFDIGVGDNTYFIVMEYVDGADLKSVIEHQKRKGEAVPIEAALLICIKLCEGLDYAHRCIDEEGNPLGIVHRDMSPPNVLITRHGEVKIVDFGLAKANSQLERSEPGIIKGKFSYLSPEAAQGYEIDHRTDIFAVGIILWEMLANRRLFLGDTDLDTVRQVQRAEVPSIRQYNPHVNPQLEAVIAKSLAREADERYQSAQDFANDLTMLLFHSGQPVSAFDIAFLVRQAVDAREVEKQHSKRDQLSIIGSLIEEALFEFTSLEEGSGDAPAPPLSGGVNWSEDLGFTRGKLQSSATEFTAGNLAALEEDEGPLRVPPSSPSPSPSPSPPQPVAQPAPTQVPRPEPVATEEPASSGGRGGLIAIILLLVLVGGAAGAYFGGLLPQDLIPR